MANSKKRCKYKECNALKETERFIKVKLNYFCNFSCAAKHGLKNKTKGAKIKHTAQKKSLKDNDKSLRLKCAQAAFNAFIRERDKECSCISCGKFRNETAVLQGSNFHAGHFYTTKARPDIRFNEDNCHLQCAHCNSYLSGNIGEYRPKLIGKIGHDRFLALGLNKVKRYSCAELKEIELLYKRKLKELKSD